MDSNQAPGASPSRYLPLLLLLFAGSGCSALIYEIVWYQMLQLAIGSTAVSLGFLLATYHGRPVHRQPRAAAPAPGRQHPLRVYALLELGIAACGILVLVVHAADRPRLHRRRGARPARHAAARLDLAPSACCRPPS